MAATISVNFATVQDVFDESAPLRNKKSVNAEVLADALGGGVVGGGYVQRTGGPVSQMTGHLFLTGAPPLEPLHAVSKSYVDNHAFTRRYYYECRSPSVTATGSLRPGTFAVSGTDIYSNPLIFFDRGDPSITGITRYLDVYRDGILQVFGQDYRIVNNPGTTVFVGTTAILFDDPFVIGTNVQVNIGNTGAFPVTFGVAAISGGYGIGFDRNTGDVSSFVRPIDFSATSREVSLSAIRDKFVSPNTLSAFPLMPRASGLFRKGDTGYNVDPNFKGPADPYGRLADGFFQPIVSKKIASVTSKADGINPNFFRAVFDREAVGNENYNVVISTNIENSSRFPDYITSASVISQSRTLSSFNFYVYDIFGSEPLDVYEINILIY
jgi:hypothetical protein